MPTLDFLYDAQSVLEDGAGATTTSAAGSNTLDIGAGVVAPGTYVVLNVSALDLANADETYRVSVQGSNDSFSTNAELGSILVTSTGRWIVAFYNFQDGTVYREIRLFFTNGGTTPSITCEGWVTGNN